MQALFRKASQAYFSQQLPSEGHRMVCHRLRRQVKAQQRRPWENGSFESIRQPNIIHPQKHHQIILWQLRFIARIVSPRSHFRKIFYKNQKNWYTTSLQTKKCDYYLSEIQHNLFKSFKNIIHFLVNDLLERRWIFSLETEAGACIVRTKILNTSKYI